MFRLWIILTLLFPRVANGQKLLDSIINSEEAKKIVQRLAADSFEGRFTGSRGAIMAARFIAAEFKKAGVQPAAGNDGYFMPFAIIPGQGPYHLSHNIIAVKPGIGKNDEIVLFSAHFDHLGTRSTVDYVQQLSSQQIYTTDTIYNGADDNASGVAALILLARFFAASNQNERTLLFVAFSGEELGLVGSTTLAELVHAPSVTAMINFDMIGRPRNKKTKLLITGSSYSQLRNILNESLHDQNPEKYGKDFFEKDNQTGNLFFRSDNRPFANKGIPAHTIMLSYPSENYYHTVKDEWETLDYERMAEVIRATAVASQSLIKGNATPKRIR